MKINTFLKLFLLLLFFFLLSIIAANNMGAKRFAEIYLPDKIKAIIKIIIKDPNYTKRFYNDYGTKFLPETQFANLNFKRIRLNFLPYSETTYFQYFKGETGGFKSFFIEPLDEKKILITNSKGDFYMVKNYEKDTLDSEDHKKINDNLNIFKVLDTFILENNLFVSYIKSKDGCNTFEISYAIFNENYLEFKKFFENNLVKCGKSFQGGRMQYFEYKKKKGLIFSLSNNVADEPNDDPQDGKSFYGKIVFKSFDETLNLIYSKGHRNPQGLFTDGNLILSTEHGPKGGDEINKIEFNKNYGWPISSYGKKYRKKAGYLQSHSEHGFEEPIYVFIPSIGISEIIKIPNDFIDQWENNFIVTSLNGASIYRVKFDAEYKRLIYAEKIFIGQRMRDVKYQYGKIFLALENKGELGILSSKN